MNFFLTWAWVGALVATGCGGAEASSDGSGSIPDEYSDLCSDSVGCVGKSSPPVLDMNYSGKGSTQSSSNELWEEGESDGFVATLDTSVAGEVSGLFDMGSFEIEVEGAAFRGEGDSFTIYGVDVFEDGECQMEARVVISGTRNTQTGDLSGSLVLEFTDNITGPGCDAEELAYPGTGATFSFTASVLDCDASLEAARTFATSDASRTCSSDVDCYAEGIGCAQFEGAFCGSIAMSVEAAFSDEWSALQDGLRACSPSICTVCDALLIPRCQNGLCQ